MPRHQRARHTKVLLIWTTSVLSALSLTGALAWPLLAQPADLRSGTMQTAIDSLPNVSLHGYPIVVSEFAPLAVFGGSGKELAIDGRQANIPVTQFGAEGQNPGSSDESLTEPGQTQNLVLPARRALLAGRVGAAGQLPGNLQLMHPVTSRRISSPYGWRSNPTGAGNQIHIGQDYPIACGSPVYASESGRVIISAWAGHSGMRITLDHGYDVHTGYSHNSKLLVRVGQNVQRGEVIALSGTTGNSTGCHVHFEVIIDGRWNDPRLYLPSNPGQPEAMIDSTRLTVDADSAPKVQTQNKPEGEKNPDVVVPEDDTPVVPEPKPTHTAKPSVAPEESTSPTPSGSPSAKPTKSATPTNSAKPTPSPKPSRPETDQPTPSAPSPSASPSHTASPTLTSSPSPSPSASPSHSPTATKSPSQEPTQSSKTPQPTASPSVSATAIPSLRTSPEAPSSSAVLPTSQDPTVRVTREPGESSSSGSSSQATVSESARG
ncbi:MAG: peptidoglycan DD-metalloendopeptidase family protein [Glutamicibacter ardleyensis]